MKKGENLYIWYLLWIIDIRFLVWTRGEDIRPMQNSYRPIHYLHAFLFLTPQTTNNHLLYKCYIRNVHLSQILSYNTCLCGRDVKESHRPHFKHIIFNGQQLPTELYMLVVCMVYITNRYLYIVYTGLYVCKPINFTLKYGSSSSRQGRIHTRDGLKNGTLVCLQANP